MQRMRKYRILELKARKRPLNKLGLRCLARKDMGFFDSKEAKRLFESNSLLLPKDGFFPKDGTTGDFQLQVKRDVYWLNTYNELLTNM